MEEQGVNFREILEKENPHFVDPTRPDDLQSYTRRLERTLRTLNAENKKLLADNEELRKKCAEHYNNCQKLIRYEFKTQAKEQRSTFGVVSGKEVVFELDPKNNNEARILPALPDKLK